MPASDSHELHRRSDEIVFEFMKAVKENSYTNAVFNCFIVRVFSRQNRSKFRYVCGLHTIYKQ